jgi:hypothetical protein
MQSLQRVNIASNNITSLRNAFLNCRNLSQSETCGENVTDMFCAY